MLLFYWYREATLDQIARSLLMIARLEDDVFYAAPVSLAASTEASSFSHGFFRLGFVACVPWPSSTVGGISLIPGTGLPLVIKSTMWAKLVG